MASVTPFSVADRKRNLRVWRFSTARRVVSNMPCPVCTIRDNGDRAGRMMPRGNGRTGLWCNSRNRDKRTCDFELDEYRYSP
ncbi:unnamed protein product [Vitrella brassicaformis CCMP3155]|uniref:Uncharacterized protein n=1 Tax=Vitrella brassicaformis (strain CCMP3155) TaxID=1169540 RepID=A0A0G4FD87_VITBC|nr:unnamed protein product [Vitrella brassicaformis CCMP3155]|eukprot:CEM11217.1 unnamed protein product [Vitrella brassicaformis CCMP3155]